MSYQYSQESYQYSQEEECLPGYSGSGEVRPSYATYLAAVIPTASASDFLNRKGLDGWELISVDGGIGYFRKAEFRVYEDTGQELIRIRPGLNS